MPTMRAKAISATARTLFIEDSPSEPERAAEIWDSAEDGRDFKSRWLAQAAIAVDATLEALVTDPYVLRTVADLNAAAPGAYQDNSGALFFKFSDGSWSDAEGEQIQDNKAFSWMKDVGLRPFVGIPSDVREAAARGEHSAWNGGTDAEAWANLSIEDRDYWRDIAIGKYTDDRD